MSALADSAEAVTQGRLDVRAPVTDDELGRLSLAFNRMTARLELADARQREFLADVAHELRTPVTSIEGFATALEDGTASSPEQRERVGRLHPRRGRPPARAGATTCRSSPGSTWTRRWRAATSTWASWAGRPSRASPWTPR